MRRLRSDSRRLQVLDAFRKHVEEIGEAPTYRTLGERAGMSAVGAWKHVQVLIHDGLLIELGDRVVLPDQLQLAAIATDKLRGELARRGVTADALEEPRLLANEGRPCAANHCPERVKRGMLMCRRHWFQLPPPMRSAIMSAWSARDMQAYGAAVEAARDHLGGFARLVERVG